MARKITMFELHFDGAQFGPSSIGRSSKAEETPAREDDEYEADVESEGKSGGRPVGRLVLASLVVSVAVSLLARRLARSGDVEEPDDDVTIEEIDGVEEPAVQ